MKEKIRTIFQTHYWCIVIITILIAFCFIKDTVDKMVMEHQQQQIEKYQALYLEQRDVYWQMVDEKNKWRNCVDSIRTIEHFRLH